MIAALPLERSESVTDLAATRRSLHGVAEFLLAGPQLRASATIRLTVRDGGFGTVAEPDVRVVRNEVVAGDRRVVIDGGTLAAIADALGIDGGTPDELYHDGSGVGPDDVLTVDVVAAARLVEAYSVGDAALRRFAPDAEPVIWPEHFDIGIRLHDVNYGVSPGDNYIGEPYAYVGVDPVPPGGFWNAPFGATSRLADLAGIDALVAFFADGRRGLTRVQIK